MIRKYKHILWDWNGTLLDDADLCFTTVNTLLTRRNLPQIKDIHTYRNIFGFPIIDYYRRAGFDFEKEPFEIPAAEFIELYHSDEMQFRLFPNAIKTLTKIGKMNIQQAILSASEVNNLHLQVNLLGVRHFFDALVGISNIYAPSKIAVGQKYIAENKIDLSKTVLIGDTAHDFDVSKALGIDCILIPNGHQQKSRLRECGVTVIDSLEDLFDKI